MEDMAVLAIHTEGLATHAVRSALPTSSLQAQEGNEQYLGTK